MLEPRSAPIGIRRDVHCHECMIVSTVRSKLDASAGCCALIHRTRILFIPEQFKIRRRECLKGFAPFETPSFVFGGNTHVSRIFQFHT